MSLGYARSVQLRGAAMTSSGKRLTATGMVTFLGPRSVFANPSQYRRAAEIVVFVNQKSVVLSSTSSRVSPVGSPSKARAMSRKLSGSWSSSQAATPIGESAMPYSVCGCHPMKNWVGMVLYKRASVSYACFSSAERPDGGGLPAAAALLISGGMTAGRFVCMPINSGCPCVAIRSLMMSPHSPPSATTHHGIRQRIDDLPLLDDRARPSMGDDNRQRILFFRTDVNEMDVQPIDLGDELRIAIELRLDLAPIVLRRPIAGELLHRRERHALRKIGDGFFIRATSSL